MGRGVGKAVTWLDRTHVGDCRVLMRQMIADGVRVQCVVTSPPYWGLRDYGVAGQFGLERTWQRHVARMRGVFRLVRELLADDGTLWLNYGDSYSGGGRGGNPTEATSGLQGGQASQRASIIKRRLPRPHDIPPKNLVGMPWRVALALQDDGWYLRSDIIWHKPNPMPESMTDRPTKAHDYVFLMTRSDRYYYDGSAITERATGNAHRRKPIAGHAKDAGSHSAKDHARSKGDMKDSTKFGRGAGWRQAGSFGNAAADLVETRNARTVWTIPTEQFRGAHFATFPKALVTRCILAGTRPGDVVFDPFMGSGTVAEVAQSLGRRYIGCELNPEYAALYQSHRSQQLGMPL
jgi:DNA modification methylase